jgi:O-antigen/teichoic acid export membrane protein
VRFAAKFQAAVVITPSREQVLNVGIAAIAGIGTLGVWNLAWRVLQVPSMVFSTLGRVGYPTMARLLGAGQDPKPVIERGVAALTVVTGAMMVALAGFAPALPGLLGRGWEAVPAALLWAGIGMTSSLPIYLTSAGYLFATDAGDVMVKAASAGAAAYVGVALGLVAPLGAPAAGIGLCAAAAVQLAILIPRMTVRTGAAVAASIAPPTAAVIASIAGGWLVARATGGSIASGCLGVATGEAILLGVLAATGRSALGDTRLILGDALRNFGSRAFLRAPTPVETPSAAP